MQRQAAEEDDDVEESGSEDGVYLFRPHTSYISGLRQAPSTSSLHSWIVHPSWLPQEVNDLLNFVFHALASQHTWFSAYLHQLVTALLLEDRIYSVVPPQIKGRFLPCIRSIMVIHGVSRPILVQVGEWEAVQRGLRRRCAPAGPGTGGV